jgi:flavodoxin I
MSKIGLFFAPKGGAVNRMSALIVEKFGEKNIDLMCVSDVNADKILEYDKLIFGNSAIHTGSLLANSDRNWKVFLDDLQKINLKGKKVAVFGLGNHLTYPKHFADSVGDLVDFLSDLDASICGKVSEEGYNFVESRAFRNDMFVGLPLDDDTESDQSEGRIACWVEQLKKEFK